MQLLRRIWSWLRRSHLENEFEEELRQHLELKVRENIARGMSPADALREARLDFGNPALAKEHTRQSWGFPLLESVLQDVRYALRQLRKNPGFTAIAALTLALGIGATTAVFSVVNAVLLRPLPYKDPQRLAYIRQPIPRIPLVPLEEWGPMNADFFDWQSQNHSFTQLAMFTADHLNLSVNGTAARVLGSRVTADFFDLLGIPPELGRTVAPGDDQQGREPVAVISHALWQARFGGDHAVLGREIQLDAHPYRIIGVMPAGFAFPHGSESADSAGDATDIWMPWTMTAKEKASREDGAGTAFGRLRPSVSQAQAQAEMSAIVARLDSLHPPMLQGCAALVQSFPTAITGGSRRALLIFMGAVFLVLLIASSNVAGLVLARATERSLEISVRTALGASRLRVVRQLLTESLCLAAAGAALGGAAALIGVHFVTRIVPGHVARLEETSVDVRVLIFTVCVSVGSGLLFGLLPALSVSRGSLNQELKNSGKRSVKGALGRLQRGLLVGEVVLTFVLLAGAGLLIRSFLKLQSVNKGFATDSIVTMQVQLDDQYSRPEQQNAFFSDLLKRVGALPGVETAAAIDHLPLGGGQSISFETEGHESDEKTFFESRSVTPQYFSTMGIPLLEGRAFTDDDVAGRPQVVIVSRSVARRYFPNQSAVGKSFNHLGEAGSARTIVGVVGDVRQFRLDETPLMQIYWPLWQGGSNNVSLMVRAAVPTGQLASEIRSVLHEEDPALALAEVRTMSQLVSGAAAERRFQMLLLSAFGGVALFLSLVGIYGLMAYSVQQRTAEIGLRMALGAQRSNVMGLILRQGSTLATIGILAGMVCAWAATRFLASWLFEIKPTDAPAFLGTAFLFCAAALAACYFPARRAMRVDPMIALRHE